MGVKFADYFQRSVYNAQRDWVKKQSRSFERTGLLGLLGFTRNRGLFKSTNQQQKSSADKRSAEFRALGQGRGVTGGEKAFDAIAKAQTGKLSSPPTPPKKPVPYYDPREAVGGPEEYKKLYRGALVPGFDKVITRGLVEKGYARLQPEQYDELKLKGDARYKKDLAQWRGLDAQFRKDLAEVNSYNAGVTVTADEVKRGQDSAREKAAASGSQRGTGGIAGIGQGATSTAPGISFIKRPNTTWI